jgi:hypothetical protein
MKTFVIAIVAVLMAISTTVAQETDPQSAPPAQQNANTDPTADMVKAKGAFQETWVNPDADFRQYDKLYLWEAIFEYRDVGEARRYRSSMMGSRKHEFGIAEADRRDFEAIVGAAFDKEIKRGKRFRIVNEIGPGTMIMRAAVLDIISRVPPETVGRSEIYLSSIGEATLVMELIDASTGESLAVVAERRAMGRPHGGTIDFNTPPTNNVTITSDVKRWSAAAARKLRMELDKAIVGR